MPRPRQPQERARITGAEIINPARFAKRRDPKTVPLGEPSKWLSGTQIEAWQMIRSELPWLMESDRIVVEIASCIRGRLIAGEDIGVSAINQLRMCAAQMGATPADRTKITTPDEPEAEPTDRYFQ